MLSGKQFLGAALGGTIGYLSVLFTKSMLCPSAAYHCEMHPIMGLLGLPLVLVWTFAVLVTFALVFGEKFERWQERTRCKGMCFGFVSVSPTWALIDDRFWAVPALLLVALAGMSIACALGRLSTRRRR